MSNSIDPRAENVKENSSGGSTLLIDQVLQLDKIFEDRERLGLIQRKSAEKATEFRNKGNQVYRKKGHNETSYRAILSFYSQSVAYAPPGSEEIALALSNRSVLWLHLHKFDLCSIDIDTALDLTKSSELKAKLIARKIKCVEMHHEYHEICCECGEFLHDDPQERNKNKETKSPILTNFDKKLEFPRFIDRIRNPESPNSRHPSSFRVQLIVLH
ncbi:hypothetical protein QAD02_006973 [Eretmocerus hayati]|uniref:Uncharacterized protein n=1 Tax=Eretmocerus hayati TaxID=131215 RepID=A0ACC2N358_9HYME|nr:hypothetical protein QAD02_006973 [Eretmocerus hayati]